MSPVAAEVFDDEPGGLLQRLLQDPIQVRRRTVIAAFVMVGVHAVASDGLNGRVPGIVYAFTWLFAPLLALTYGYGSAFFIQHGVGARKAMVQLVVGVLVLLGSCVALTAVADPGDTAAERAVSALLNAGLYGAVIFTLGAAIALGLGRGPDYIGKRVQSLDDDDVL